MNMSVELLSEVQGTCFHSSSESSSAAVCSGIRPHLLQLHSSVQTRLLDLQEQRREHVLLLD